jgi:hypothetical protein
VRSLAPINGTSGDRDGTATKQPIFPTGRDSFDPPLDQAAWLWRHVVDLLGDVLCEQGRPLA